MTAPRSDPKSTLLVITTGFVALFFLFKQPWMLMVAVVAGIIGIFLPGLGRLVEMAWFKLALVLGWINSKILLSSVFFLILTPIALLRRLVGNDDMDLRAKAPGTQWKVRDHAYGPRDLEKPW